MKIRYFDHAATNPLHPEALDAMMPYLKNEYGNPLGIYDLGQNARDAVEQARQETALLVNAKPAEIIFTASGAEANNFALKGLAMARQNDGKHLIVSRAEHHSITNTARSLEKLGWVVTFLPLDKYGTVDPQAVKNAINKETTVISVIHASSEIGTIEPIKEIARIAGERGVAFHTDAVSTTGNIPVDVKELEVDALSMSAHQFYGPKGAGALYLKQGSRILPLIYGGIQEGGRRAGTENVPAIVGMGKAAALAVREMDARAAHVKKLRDRLIDGLTKIDKVHLTGHPVNRLPGHASFVVEYIEGEGMLLMLAAKGVYAASGSACTSKALKSSPVLLSMGVSSSMSHGSIVLSLGMDNTDEDADVVLAELSAIINRLREMSPFAKSGWGELKEGE